MIDWYLVNKRDLPWRETKKPYEIWLSEIIMQQTRIEQGLPYFNRFVEEFPTVFDLAKASEEKVLKLWQGLGYYSRARNLHFTAKYVVNELNGEFPDTFDELKKLKGVGDYTASAIASFSFGEVQPVVDGNVYRVLSRYLGIDIPINNSTSLKKFKQAAFELIDKGNPGDFNQAIMEFGAKQCKPKNPDCNACPFNDSCYALKHKKIDSLPVKLKKIKVKKRYFNYLVFITENDDTLLEKREGEGIWKNLYQFPLIETAAEVTIDLIQDEQLLKDHPVQEISLYNDKPIVHKLSHQHLITKFWIVNVREIKQNSIPISSLHKFPVPILVHNFIEAFKF